MAKFEIPQCVATINVVRLDGSIVTERYKTENDFVGALVRANKVNKRGTYKELVEYDADKKEAWIVIKSKTENDSED